MKTFSKYLSENFIVESAASDRYEAEVAQHLSSMDLVNAERPKVSTAYSDVLVTLDGGETSWIEVKMNHTDNLTNPRIFYDGRKWDTTYTTTAAQRTVEIMGKSREAKDFIEAISKFSGIKNPMIPTTKSGLKDKSAVPLAVMKEYFSQPGINRYIANDPNIDLGKVVTDHYLKGKKEPAYYMQAGDDFYMIGRANPLGLPKDIPLLSGSGPFKVRIATRSAYYEVQAEIKIAKMPDSRYSIKPGTRKKNPFERLK